jgi:hypothetical protein
MTQQTAAVLRAVADGPAVDPDWIAFHIFYSSSSNPLLEELVAPLVDELRAEGLVSGFFFLRYWMEGPHIRFRLRPTAPEHRERVEGLVGSAVDAYLARRPALYRLDPEVLGPLYKDMFLMEYTEDDWARRFGEDGIMPMQPTNTWAVRDYEPEYEKYGGVHGVRLAERHFEESSDLVLELVRSTNMHVRTVMFGCALQLMAVACAELLRDREDVGAFLRMYQKIWEGTFLAEDSATKDGFEANYQSMAQGLADRLGPVVAAVLDGDGELSGFLGRWHDSCRRVRVEIEEHARAGLLVLADGYPAGQRSVVTDPEACLRSFLVPFVHMTNNRLGVSIVDEVYLSHLVVRTLEDLPR